MVLVNMADFALKNNYFELDSKAKKHISGTAIENKMLLFTRVSLRIRWKGNFLRHKI